MHLGATRCLCLVTVVRSGTEERHGTLLALTLIQIVNAVFVGFPFLCFAGLNTERLRWLRADARKGDLYEASTTSCDKNRKRSCVLANFFSQTFQSVYVDRPLFSEKVVGETESSVFLQGLPGALLAILGI